MLAIKSDRYTHILIIPCITAYFLFKERKILRISQRLSWYALLPVVAGIAVSIAAVFFIHSIYPIVQLCFLTIGFLLIFSGGTFFLFGFSLISSYRFPWFFLLLGIPIPSYFLSFIIKFLQYGSAEVVALLLKILGLDYYRDNLTFYLSSINIFIAPECSGIRTAIVLLLTGILFARVYCKTSIGKTIVCLSVVPLVVFKNGLRITTLTVLAEEIDTKWLTDSALHHNGGLIFFGIVLLILFGIGFIVRKYENKNSQP